MRARRVASLALVFSASLVVTSAQLPSGSGLTLRDRSTTFVAVRIERADGHQVDVGASPAVRPSATFDGEVRNLPLSAHVWLAARSIGGGRSAKWQVLAPHAEIAEQERWSAHVDLPCAPDNREATCEVMAFVSRETFEARLYDEAEVHAKSFKTFGPVRLHVTSPGASQATVIAIDRLSGLPVGEIQATGIPSTFDAEGSSRGINGRRLWLVAQCAPDPRWYVLGHTTVAEDGAWEMRAVSLPAPQSASTRTCLVHAATAAQDPPAQVLDVEALTTWATLSSRIALTRHPYFLSFTSFTDSDGRVHPQSAIERDRRPSGLASDVRAAELETEPLPQGVRVWQVVRCDGCSVWLAFGPGQTLGATRHALAVWQSGYPARRSTLRYRTMAIAARQDLEGRALSQTELEEVALGTSRMVTLERRARTDGLRASVEIDRDRERDQAPALAGLAGRVLDATLQAELPSDRLAVYAGYLDPDSALWIFHRAARVGDRYRVSASLQEDVGRQRGGRTILVPVVAESLPVGRGIRQEWWSEMVSAVGEPVSFELPSPPWYSRALPAPFSPSPSSPDQSSFNSQEASVSRTLTVPWLIVIACAVAGAAVPWLWRRATLLRAVWNGWIDGRRQGPLVGAAPAPFTALLAAMTEGAIARLRRRAGQRLGPMRQRLETLEQRLRDVYLPEFERLKTKTGRHDASTPLSPTAHHLLLVALTIGESSFNLAVFYVFREPAIYTLLMALAVAVAIPICAFSVGLWIRRWRSPWLGQAAKLATTIALLTAALIGLNRVRMAHLASVAPDFVRDHPDINGAFLSFNALIFVASAMVTHWGHDVEENFAEAKAKVERLRAHIATVRGGLAAAENDLETAIAIEQERGRYYAAVYQNSRERHRPAVRPSELGVRT